MKNQLYKTAYNYDPIYIILEDGQNYLVMLEIWIVVTFGKVGEVVDWEYIGGLLDSQPGYIHFVIIYQAKHYDLTRTISTLFSM